MKIAARLCVFLLLLTGTAVSAADINKDGIINKDGSLTVQGTVVTPPESEKDRVVIKTLAGVILDLSEPKPEEDVVTAEKNAAAAEKQANDARDAAQKKFDASNKTPEDNAAFQEAQKAADKAKSDHVAALEAANRRFVPYSLKKGDFVEVTYLTEPSPTLHSAGSQALNGLTRDRLMQPVKKIGATLTGTITSIASDLSWIVLRTEYPPSEADQRQNVPIQTPLELQATVKQMSPGDGVSATYIARTNNIRTAQSLEWRSIPVAALPRVVSLIIGAVVLFALAFVFCGGHPTRLIVGKDKRYSTSLFQTAIWFWLVLTAYIALVGHRLWQTSWSYVGGVDIPVNLAALSGISVFTFTAAKFITIGQIDRAAEKGQTTKEESKDGPHLRDLITNDAGDVDLGDFQMLVITLLAIAVYAFSVFEFMQNIELRRTVMMPDLDATLLAIFGLGQLAYLGKKVAGEGLSPAEVEYASKTVATAVANTKVEADKADEAAKTAAAKARDAQAALNAEKAATTKATASPEAEKAEHAAIDASAAASAAAVASKNASQYRDEANKLETDWSRHPDIEGIKKSVATARADATRAEDSARSASQSVQSAKEWATTARSEANGKP